MKIYGITIISSDGDILVTKDDGTTTWTESMTKLFLNKQDCTDYAIKQAKISFNAYDFETGETVPEDVNNRTYESFVSDLKDGEDICIQGYSSHTCFEYFTQELDIYPVVCHYSFDTDTPVTLCASEEEAKQVLHKDYEEEYRIQTEENGHEKGCDLNAKISDDGTYAEIYIDAGTGEEPDKIEWSIGRIYQENSEKSVDCKRKATNIIWDFDEGDEDSFTELPDHIEIPNDIDNDDIADYLSDNYGWCVVSFNIEET